MDLDRYVEELAAEALANYDEAAAPKRSDKESAEALAPPEPPLESVIKGRVIELWSDKAGRLFLVADQEDARLAMERYGLRRGEIYTASEARRIVAIGDPAIIAEIHQWKREFDGKIRPERLHGACAKSEQRSFIR
jgi:hypothetical protein